MIRKWLMPLTARKRTVSVEDAADIIPTLQNTREPKGSLFVLSERVKRCLRRTSALYICRGSAYNLLMSSLFHDPLTRGVAS